MSNYPIIPPIYCVCLDKRQEHWQRLRNDANKLGLEFNPFICGDGSHADLIYDQIDYKKDEIDLSRWGYSKEGHQINHYNALSAHKNIVKLAMNRGLESFLMMEDDAIFLNRFEYVVSKLCEYQEYIDYIKSFSLVYLGYWNGQEDDDFNVGMENRYKTDKFVTTLEINENNPVAGLHGCIIRNDVYQKILDFPFNNPLDSQFCKNRASIPSLIVCPKIVHTKDMWSNTEGCFLKRKVLE
jgi:hypothetical protein